jgi:hypothetical protein
MQVTHRDRQIGRNTDAETQKYGDTEMRRLGHTETQTEKDTLEGENGGYGDGNRTLAHVLVLGGGAVAVNRSPCSARSSA